MRTSGGRGAGVGLACVLPALLVSGLLAGCAEDTDRSHLVQTHLGRIDQVESVEVTTPTATEGPAISVTFDGGDVDTATELAKLIADIDTVAHEEHYPAYRLDLAPKGDDASLTVGAAFSGSAGEETILKNWYAVRDALIGAVHEVAEPGVETITVGSGGGIAHDVDEAGRIGYGSAATTWVFVNGDTTFIGSGSIGPDDVTLFQDVQRTVSSESLPAAAPGWTLYRRDGHVRLDLDVVFQGESVPPAQLTIERYGPDVAQLARAAIAAASEPGLPVFLDLDNATADGTDDFASWTSGQAPAKGRDRLDRGWDAWLATLARSAGG